MQYPTETRNTFLVKTVLFLESLSEKQGVQGVGGLITALFIICKYMKYHILRQCSGQIYFLKYILVNSTGDDGSFINKSLIISIMFIHHCCPFITVTSHEHCEASYNRHGLFVHDNIKISYYWPRWGEYPITPRFLSHRDSNVESDTMWWQYAGVRLMTNIFHFSYGSFIYICR